MFTVVKIIALRVKSKVSAEIHLESDHSYKDINIFSLFSFSKHPLAHEKRIETGLTRHTLNHSEIFQIFRDVI